LVLDERLRKYLKIIEQNKILENDYSVTVSFIEDDFNSMKMYTKKN